MIHLIAIAGRLDIDLPLERFDEISRKTPFIVDVKPSRRCSATDVHRAGGILAVMKQLESPLELDVMTVTGKTLKGKPVKSGG